jgi:serine protease AprX
MEILMSNSSSFAPRSRFLAGMVAWAFMLIASLVSAPPALAAHRAHLSADLEDHLTAGSQVINVIVHGDKAAVDALAVRYNLVIKRYLKSGAVLTVNAGQLTAMRQDETVDHLSGDVRVHSATDITAQSVGADQVWDGAVGHLPELSGAGIGVALIDSGIDTRHNALKKRIVATVDFTGGDGADQYGHGTHVAGIIAGLQGRTADTRKYRGIASGAHLINLRVLGADGSGTVSNVVEAIDWAIEHRVAYRIRVINLSMGAPVLQPYRDDPLCEAVERATQAGIVVVVAAGNYGRTADGRSVYGAITSPGNSPHALTVGAIDTHGTPQRSDDTLAAYSSKGPTRYDLVIKPDLAAPGSHIVSAEAVDGYLSRTYPQRHVAGAGPNAYFQLSGTSMSAGVVSGAAALLLEERPDLAPRTTRAVLQVTSTFLPAAGLLGAGAGSVNVLAAAEMGRGQNGEITLIAGEKILPSGLLFALRSDGVLTGQSIVWGAGANPVKDSSIVWGASIVWGCSIVWGASSNLVAPTTSIQSIVWGAASPVTANSIVWGCSIVWGAADPTPSSIVWGAAAPAASSIVWGATAPIM